MRPFTFLILTILILALVGANRNDGDKTINRSLTDESSFSNINEIRTEHFDLTLDLDFDKKVFHGMQFLTLRTQTFGVNHVLLDISDLTILNITDYYGNTLNYTIQNPNPELGQMLNITIPREWFPYEHFYLNITYDTSVNAGALTWLDKEQTAGKKLPYVYTQCQTIFWRSIVPIQDTPAIKSTYNLHITSPQDIVVRASGNVTHEFIDEEKRHTLFEMNIPVESYLLAIAAGNIVEAQVGKRTFVLSEPEMIEKVKAELVDLENALETAENYFTPYVWGVYKVIILPPSFPLGGMENPLLTFMSPTHIVGDKSSFGVFVHEINHSWFGNLVTNENWSHFWLNEGITTWAERKVDSILFGEDFAKISAKLGNETLYSTMLGYGLDSNFTSLHPVFNGIHPDKAFSSVPYEKGFQFTYYLEHLVQPENFKKFLREYINEHYQKSINADEFRSSFESFVKKNFSWKNSTEILSKIDWEAWLYKPGMPPVAQNFETPEYDQAIKLARDYIVNKTSIPDAKTLYSQWNVDLKNLFITQFLKQDPMISADLTGVIDSDLSISSELNTNILTRWYQLEIRSGKQVSPFAAAESLVGSIGKTSAVVPVYSAMITKDKNAAMEMYQRHKSFYHPITRTAIEASFASSTVTLISE